LTDLIGWIRDGHPHGVTTTDKIVIGSKMYFVNLN
jgi:hypothetical protein